MARNPLNQPERLIVHCSDYGKQHTEKDVHLWHMKRGFDGIGYHDVIDMEGNHKRGRPWYWKGGHAKAGGWNSKSIGVCMLGKRMFIDAQYDALEAYILRVLKVYPDLVVCGHRDVDNQGKTCPNFDVKEWVKSRPALGHVRTA